MLYVNIFIYIYIYSYNIPIVFIDPQSHAPLRVSKLATKAFMAAQNMTSTGIAHQEAGSIFPKTIQVFTKLTDWKH